MTLTPRQIAALKLSIAIAFDGALKPRNPSQAQMVRDDAKAALAAIEQAGAKS